MLHILGRNGVLHKFAHVDMETLCVILDAKDLVKGDDVAFFCSDCREWCRLSSLNLASAKEEAVPETINEMKTRRIGTSDDLALADTVEQKIDGIIKK